VNWIEWVNAAAAMALSGALNSLWTGLLLAALAALAVRMMPRSNATTRYAVWWIALVLALAVPVVIPFVPRPAAPSLAVPAPAIHWTVPVTAEWPVYAVLAWLGMAAILLARVGWSLLHIAALKRGAAPIGSRGRIRLLASGDVRVPMAAGFLRRAVIFPQGLLEQLTPEEFDQILRHELAHLRRWDDWTQLFQAVAQAVLFFNPALYWIGRRLKIEREMACDDWVVAATGRARPYAACLTHLHELTRRASAPQLAPGATARTRWQITARVEALLRPGRQAAPRFARSGWIAALALVSAALVAATQIAPPVGVQELPLASIQLASLPAPHAPAIARTPARAAPPRFRLLARAHRRAPLVRPAGPAAPVIETGIVLVNWRIQTPPSYLVITVIFFEPPPPAMTRI
jgi:bla regulator protein blaR1